MNSAHLSHCGKYRYALTRVIDSCAPTKKILFIMLNPSTADATENDPTIKKCMKFARREGCGLMTVVNLFAYRATDPDELAKVDSPVGTCNEQIVMGQIKEHNQFGNLIVAAWGNFKMAKEISIPTGAPIWCLGKNKDGSPKHPLYRPDDTPLESFYL